MVARRQRQPHGSRAHLGTQLWAQRRARRLLDDLLVAALDRAFALEEMDTAVMRVGQHLDLDMARALDQPLEEHRVVAEGRARLALRGLERSVELRGAFDHAHALAAAAGASLDQQREADPRALAAQCRGALVGAHVAGDGRQAGGLGQVLGGDLRAH